MTKQLRHKVFPLIAFFLVAMNPSSAYPEDGDRQALDVRTIADSAGEFSGRQGQDGWYYGYYNGDSSNPYSIEDFEQLPVFAGSWTAGGTAYWTEISADGGHPNGQITSGGRKAEPQWAVRRWVSDASGMVTLTGRLAKRYPGSQGDGIDGYIIVDGEIVWSQHIGEGDTVGVEYALDVFVNSDSILDFALAPGNSDWQDSGLFSAVVVARKPLTLEAQLAEFADETVSSLKKSEAGTVAFSGFVGQREGDSLLGASPDRLTLSELRKLDAFRLVEADALAQALAETGRTRSELRDTAAAIEVGRLLGVRYMITGVIIEMISSVILFARIIDIRSESVVAASQAVISLDPEDLEAFSR